MPPIIKINDSNPVIAKDAEFEFSSEDLYVMFGSLFRGILIMRAILDDQGTLLDFKWVFCTQRSENLFGRKLIGKTLQQTFPLAIEQGRFAAYKQVYETGKAFQTMFPLALKDEVIQAHLLAEKLGENILISITDLNYKLDLNESEERFRFMAESIPHIVYTARPDGSLDYSNSKWSEYTGLPELLPVDFIMLNYIHPHDRDEAIACWTTMLQEGIEMKYDNRILGKDGLFRWFQNRVVPLKDSAGNVLKWFGTATDIHDEKLFLEELRHTKEDLENKNSTLQRLNTDLDSFVYTASHELTAPIANLSGLTTLLSMELKELIKDSHQHYLDMMHDSILKLQHTIFELTRKILVETEKNLTTHTVSFLQVYQDVLEDLKDILQAGEAKVSVEFEVAHIEYAEKNLRTILQNLLSNAVKYRAPDRPLEIHIASRQTEHGVLLTVSDSGTGIPAGEQENVFSIHNKFNSGTSGMGYGLYMIRRIIENHGGTIDMQSELGRGCHFEVNFGNI